MTKKPLKVHLKKIEKARIDPFKKVKKPVSHPANPKNWAIFSEKAAKSSKKPLKVHENHKKAAKSTSKNLKKPLKLHAARVNLY